MPIAKKPATVISLFFDRVRENPGKTLVHFKQNGAYTSLTRGELGGMVMDLAAWLMKKGVKKGDRVAVFSFNRYEWWVADLAILSLGAVTVPIYPTNSADESLYILKNSGTKFVFVGDVDQKQRIAEIRTKAKSLGGVIAFDSELADRRTLAFSAVLAEGAKCKKRPDPKKLPATPKDLCSIIYTSGTTGHPKGVALTHANFYSDADQTWKVFLGMVTEHDRFMSFLPLSHALERTAAYYTAILFYGAEVAFAESIRTVVEDMKIMRPTVLNSVPRLYEKMHSGVAAQIAEYPLIKRLIVRAALAAGRRCVPDVMAGRVPGGLRGFLFRTADNVVLSKIRHSLGIDRVKVAISGGAALAVNDFDFFLGLGVSLYEGYGLTECAPILTVNKPGNIRRGTVGPALCDTEIRLSDEGEILAKGPQIMKGYYKNPAATKEVFDRNGFFKTGDLGMLDEAGYLRITGRIKDIIVTAGGKNISPQNIENALKKSPFIEQVAIIGDKRKYLTALIVVNAEEVTKFAHSKGIAKDLRGILADEVVIARVAQDIEALTIGFARVEQVRRFTLLADEWSIAGGELTGTLKIKRRVVEAKYADLIENMYVD